MTDLESPSGIHGLPLTFLPFRLCFRSRDRGSLPRFLGATLRGGFGKVFKRVVCLDKNGQCEACTHHGQCPYSYVFETPVTERITKLDASFAPHPFVLAPRVDGRVAHAGTDGMVPFAPGDPLDVELTLFGHGIGYLPFLVATFESLGRAGLGRDGLRFDLDGVDVLDVQEKTTPIFDGSRRAWLRALPPPLAPADVTRMLSPAPVRGAWLDLVSPLRLVVEGTPVRYPDAPTIMRALLRRVSALVRCHCGSEPAIDYEGVIRLSSKVAVDARESRWDDAERTSTRQLTWTQQRASMKLGGLVGRLHLTGDVGGLLPWLMLGQYVHLGKTTSFGLGRYRVIVEP